jgi:hypothetical protein
VTVPTPLPPGVQFDRTASVQIAPPTGAPMVINPPLPPIAGVRPAELRTMFSVRKSMSGGTPHTAEIRVHNLSELSRSTLARVARSSSHVPGVGPTTDAQVYAGTQASLIAGYANALPGRLISGALLRAPSRHVGTEWITTLSIADGAVELARAECDRAFEAGTPALEVVRYCCQCMGFALAPIPVPAALAAYVLARGFTAAGRARETLDAILAGVAPDLSQLPGLARAVIGFGQLFDSFAGGAPLSRPLVWWVEDRMVWILERGAALPAPPIVVSARGLPGAALLLERADRGEDGQVRLPLLLHPGFRLARAVQVLDPPLAGLYRVNSLEHQGDNRAGTFTTTAMVLPTLS